MLSAGAVLLHPYDRCWTGRHVGALDADVTPTTITLNNPPRYTCGCLDPRDRDTLDYYRKEIVRAGRGSWAEWR